MSWKITKKLKETHLAPLANPFSRTSSTSTIVASDTPHEPTQTPRATTVHDQNGIAASEAEASPPPQPSKPGILVVSLHEGRGFKLSDTCRQLLEHGQTTHDSGLANRPQTTSFTHNAVTHAFGAFHRPSNSATGSTYNPKPNHGRYSVKDLPYVMIEFDKQQVFVSAVSGTPDSPLWAGDNSAYKFDVSRATEITVSIFLRNLRAPQSAGRSADIMLATCKIKPKLEEKMQSIEEAKAKKASTTTTTKETSQGQSGTEWLPVQTVDCALDKDSKQPIQALATPAFLKVGVTFLEERQRSLSLDDFDLLKVVGKGSFGKVMQVRKKDTHRIYALKSIRKAHIISRSEVAHTLAERSVLAQINNPFIVPLKFSFQSPDKLYLVLAFVNGGELFSHLQNVGKFGWHRARFYAAELLCALECLHGFNIIYRDLKPENILIDYSGHIALCDFGLCKLDMKDQDTTNTFCGTPEYLAPELLNGAAYTKAVDWWTLGVLLFEMLAGLPPFYDENTNEMYQKILHMPLNLKPVAVDPELERSMGVPPGSTHEILEKLLDRNATKRLGANGAADIKAHPYFNGIDWRKLLNRQYPPQFKPNVADQLDTGNFATEFTSEAPQDSYVDGPMLSSTVQQQFAGWSYNRPIPGLGAGESVKDPSFGSFAS